MGTIAFFMLTGLWSCFFFLIYYVPIICSKCSRILSVFLFNADHPQWSLLTNFCKATVSWSFFGIPILNIKTPFLYQMTFYFNVYLLLPLELKKKVLHITALVISEIINGFYSFILVKEERDSLLLSWFFIDCSPHSWADTCVKTVITLSDALGHLHWMLHCKLVYLSLYFSFLSVLTSSFLSFVLSLFFILRSYYSAESHISFAHSSTNTLISLNFIFGWVIWTHDVFQVALELAIFLLLNTQGLC